MEKIIGCHVPFVKGSELLGSVMQAIEVNANAFMIYTGPNQSSYRSKIDETLTNDAHKLMKEKNIHMENVFVHAPFIVNLANNLDERKYKFYVEFMKEEIERCKFLGIKSLVFHPGSRLNIPKEEAILNIANGINEILQDVEDFNLIIEYMSGKGSECGTSIDELAQIYKNVIKKDLVSFCLDTCHINDSGIDLSKFDEFLDEFDKKIGINKISLIHLNDSKNSIASHKDRHENIGYGSIGFNTLIDIAYNSRLNVPLILETPFVDGICPYKEEIESIRKKEFNDFIRH